MPTSIFQRSRPRRRRSTSSTQLSLEPLRLKKRGASVGVALLAVSVLLGCGASGLKGGDCPAGTASQQGVCRPSGATDRAAQREYEQIDAKLKQSYDYDSGHQRYAGGPNDVVDQYREVLNKVPFWYRQLEAVTTKHPSKYWEVACKVRVGSLYDSPATGLRNVEAPSLRLYEPEQEAMLKQAEAADGQLMQIRAQDIRKEMEGKWGTLVEVETTSIYRLAVRNYAEAMAQSQEIPAYGAATQKQAKYSSPELEYAVRRYGTLSALLGAEKMREFTQDIEGFEPPRAIP